MYIINLLVRSWCSCNRKYVPRRLHVMHIQYPHNIKTARHLSATGCDTNDKLFPYVVKDFHIIVVVSSIDLLHGADE